MKTKLGAGYDEEFKAFADNDLALEWCEQRLLESFLRKPPRDAGVTPRDYELLAQLTAEELAIVVALFHRRQFKPAEIIVAIGGEPDEMYFLARGQASVLVPHASGDSKRLATFSAGMTFGEMAVLDHAKRSATVVADSEVECDVLSLADFEGLGRAHPEIKIKLLEAVALSLCQRLRRVTRELAALND